MNESVTEVFVEQPLSSSGSAKYLSHSVTHGDEYAQKAFINDILLTLFS